MSKNTSPQDASFEDSQIGELRAAFDFYGGKDDQLKKDDLRSIMAKLNFSTNKDMLEKMMKDADVANVGYIDFTAFMTMMLRKMQKSDNKETLMDAFRVFDRKGSGFVDSDELYKLLTTMGKGLNESEWKEVNAVANKDGKFCYLDLVNEIFGASITS